MEIKKILNNTLNFTFNRLIEVINLVIIIIGILLLISLLSYSPEDPNFIFPNNTIIKNIIGFRGSFVADLFYQSLGLISLLIPFTLILTGLHIFFTKKISVLIESFFYITLYSLIGSLFFAIFYPSTFKLYINGNGGFVGKYIETKFLNFSINLDNNISYYLFIIIISILFLISVQFNSTSFYNFIKKIYKILFSKKEKNYTNKNEIINEYIPQDEIKSLIQEDLPFIKNETNQSTYKEKFKLPSVNLLKMPSKKESNNSKIEDEVDTEFLEKILLDFGVNGNIKKISHGPVVTLNEFEPAAGVKVSKIINLSDDIARNTSSESARIATILAEALLELNCQTLLEKMST